MTRGELELLPDIRDFTTVFFLGRESLEWSSIERYAIYNMEP